MKKIPLLCALILFSSLHAAAQSKPGYRFDNFDTSDGVHVQTPARARPAAPAVAATRPVLS